MIEIRYSSPNALDISGTVTELRALCREILAIVQSTATCIAFDADSSINPDPYLCALSKLLIMKHTGRTKVSVVGEKEVHIAGEPNCLEALSSFFDSEGPLETGVHSHHEYYEGNDWIDPDSIPLVVSVK